MSAARSNMLTRKVKTAFGSMYLHVEFDELGHPVGGSISDPGKEPESRIAQLVRDLSRGLDDLFKGGPGGTDSGPRVESNDGDQPA